MTSDYSEVTQVHEPQTGETGASAPGEAALVMIYGEFLGRRYSIGSNALVIGRAADCGIQLTDDCVSRRHCRINSGRDGIVLTDLESTNGTYVNGGAVAARHLTDGDRVKVGRSIFKFLSSGNIEQAYHEEIYRLKTTDGLTGAFNKRFFEEELEREIYRFFRYQRPLSLIMMDIDHFKRINDEYGHLAGDRVLAQLGTLISSSLRLEDTFCRYGGEEFTVLMPEMEVTAAVKAAERLRALVADAHFEFEGLDLPVTISLGVDQASEKMPGPDDFVKRVDELLYRAKRRGRNRVESPLSEKEAD